jgi:hypothetical protein
MKVNLEPIDSTKIRTFKQKQGDAKNAHKMDLQRDFHPQRYAGSCKHLQDYFECSGGRKVNV